MEDEPWSVEDEMYYQAWRARFTAKQLQGLQDAIEAAVADGVAEDPKALAAALYQRRVRWMGGSSHSFRS